MARITGKLNDFAGNLGASVSPRIVFRPNGAAFSENRILYARPVIIDSFESDGSFEVELVATTPLIGVTGNDVYYDVVVERLVSSGDYMPWDHPGWKLRVPSAGGALSDLLEGPTNPAQIWVGPGRTPTSDVPAESLTPSMYTGWLKTNALPGDPNYYEWT